MPFDRGNREMRDLAKRHHDRRLDLVRQVTQPRTKDDCDARHARAASADCLSCLEYPFRLRLSGDGASDHTADFTGNWV